MGFGPLKNVEGMQRPGFREIRLGVVASVPGPQTLILETCKA